MGGRGDGEVLVKGAKLPLCQTNMSGGPRDSTDSVANNNKVYT